CNSMPGSTPSSTPGHTSALEFHFKHGPRSTRTDTCKNLFLALSIRGKLFAHAQGEESQACTPRHDVRPREAYGPPPDHPDRREMGVPAQPVERRRRDDLARTGLQGPLTNDPGTQGERACPMI